MMTPTATPRKPLRYDVHTHVGLDFAFYLHGWWPYAATTQDLLGHMDANGIDRAVCFPFTLPSALDPYAYAESDRLEFLPGRVPFDRENEMLVRELERIDTDGRLFAFAFFDPARQVPEQVKLLEKLAGSLRGLKTQTTMLQSPIRALLDEGSDLMAFAEQHNLPVLLHTAVYEKDRWAQAADCLAVAEHYPKVRFNLAHSIRFHLAHLKRAACLPNVWVDCAAHLAHCRLAAEPDSPFIAPRSVRVDADYSKPAEVLEAVHAVMGGKYMWGSDNPYMSWSDEVIRVLFTYREEVDVLRALPESTQADMAGTAPEAWLFGPPANIV